MSHEIEMLRTQRDISNSLKELIRILAAINQNILTVAKKVNECLDSENIEESTEENPNQMYITDSENTEGLQPNDRVRILGTDAYATVCVLGVDVEGRSFIEVSLENGGPYLNVDPLYLRRAELDAT